MTEIGSMVVKDCPLLTAITVDPANSIFDSRENCSAIIETASDTLTAGCRSTVIPASVTRIGAFAFDRCTALTSNTLPDAIKEIGESAFASCTALTAVTMPASAQVISDAAFMGCSALRTVDFSTTIKSIGDMAFYDCAALSDVTLPESVTDIGSLAFFGCKALKNVTIPASAARIGVQAFGYAYDPVPDEDVRIESFTLRGYRGSSVQQYADANGLAFAAMAAEPATPDEPAPSLPDKPLPATPDEPTSDPSDAPQPDAPTEPDQPKRFILGDTDGDGTVTILDATTVQRCLAGIPTTMHPEAADADGDGEVTILDATAIQRHLTSLPTNERIGQSIG